MQVGRNAAPVVGDGARAVWIERDGHLRGVAGERLVDGVIDDLVDHVVQARAVVGVPDVHAGALANRIKALQDLDGFGAIVGFSRCCITGRFGHAGTFESMPENVRDSRVWCDTKYGYRLG